MRKYQRIWEAIKESPLGETKIAADTPSHRRIIKAVIKEKSKDHCWQLLMAEKNKNFKLEHCINGKMIIFTLKDVSPITINML